MSNIFNVGRYTMVLKTLCVLSCLGLYVQPLHAVYYSAPYYNTSRYPYGGQPGDTVDAAIANWWSAYRTYWGINCAYTPTYYADGAVTGRFASMRLHSGCGGGDVIVGTAYESPPITPTPKQSGSPSQCSNTPVASNCDPINFATGNKYKIQTDYSSSVNYGLRFTRTYNSLSNTDDDSVMGSHWHHNHDIRLDIDTNVSPVQISAVRSDSKVFTFIANSSGGYDVDGDVNLQLVTSGAGYQLTTSSDEVEVYNSSGQLRSITNKAGLIRTYTHDLPAISGGDGDNTTLDQITDPFGRTLSMTYNSAGKIESIIDPDGQTVRYGYDTNNNLTTVIYPDETPADISDTPVKTYHYENTNQINALTGITNENGNRVETYTYHDDGRAATSEVTSGIRRVEVNYNEDGTTTVLDTAGETRIYTFETILEVNRPTSITDENGNVAPCIGCGSIQSAQYDSNGNVTQSTDFNGNITSYTYDSRNLETSRTEGVGTANERTITTQWHNDYRLPIQINRPGQRTTYTYDTQGKLLTRTVEDTDTNSPTQGETRTTAYTYNTQGLMASIDGPRTDVSDTTTYQYDSEGNRIQTTNALNQTTQITAHNAHGQPTELINANGLVTQLTYDARRRMTQKVVAPNTDDEAITQYQYDGVGNVTQITLPDGSQLKYEYDIASRLTAIEDSLGNRMEYTLDAQGNRIDEQTKDPAGQLTRQIQRTYDGLNRLQQVIGAGG